MSKVTPVTSSAHFKTLTSSAIYTVVDFYADWCGPCKTISPIFEQLAAAEHKAGRIIFVKVNVDAQRDIASEYGVSAMPTFLVLKGRSVHDTVRGANPTALRTAVLSAAAEAARGTARSSASFSTKGHTLGATGGAQSRAVSGDWLPDFSALISSPAQFSQRRGFLAGAVRFVGLYLTSLFSLVPVRAAAESAFSVQTSSARARTAR